MRITETYKIGDIVTLEKENSSAKDKPEEKIIFGKVEAIYPNHISVRTEYGYLRSVCSGDLYMEAYEKNKLEPREVTMGGRTSYR